MSNLLQCYPVYPNHALCAQGLNTQPCPRPSLLKHPRQRLECLCYSGDPAAVPAVLNATGSQWVKDPVIGPTTHKSAGADVADADVWESGSNAAAAAAGGACDGVIADGRSGLAAAATHAASPNRDALADHTSAGAAAQWK